MTGTEAPPTVYEAWQNVMSDVRKVGKHCTVSGCEGAYLARGFCRRHYDRWRRTGDPLKTLHQHKFEGRFWARVDRQEAGCWNWTGALNSAGYGHVGRDGGVRRTHRVAYELLVGPIPEGLHLDHLCRNRACCNPEHLEPVTNAENIRRAAAAKTHCKNGHPYTAENVYVRPTGSRYCTPCRIERDRKTV